MVKKYNLFILARLYLKSYYRFLVKETNIKKSSEAHTLFIHSMKRVYRLESVEFCPAVDYYADKCIEYLNNLPDTPKNKNNISFEDRVRLVSICEGYAKLTSDLTHKCISNSRVEG